MSATVTLTLGGKDYTVGRLRLGELEIIAEMDQSKPVTAAINILELILKRAQPAFEGNLRESEISPEEVVDAVNKVMVLSGAQSANPPQPVAVPATVKAA